MCDVFERDAAPAGTRTRSSTTASRSTPASSCTTRATTRCSAGSSTSSASRRTSRTCRSRSAAAAAGSSTRAAARSRSRRTPRGRAFLALLWEIGRWLRTRALARRTESQSLAEYLDEHGYSQRFRRHFLVPLTSALWSTAPGRALEFPAAYAIRFFDNHGMLGFGRFRWRTVTGGSRSYVDAIARRLGDAAPARPRRPLAPAHRRRRRAARRRRAPQRFDHVVVATHADQALALLEDPTTTSGACSAASSYTTNEAVLHTDSSFLPRARARPRVVELPPRRRRPADGHLPPEPAAGARRRARLLRDAERARPRRARARPVHLRASALHRRDAAGAARAAAPRGGGARTTRARTSATASTRTASRPASRRARALGVAW